MSAAAIKRFLDYFERFETALNTGIWEPVGDALEDDAVYTVEGVPFACEIKGRDAILQGFEKSTAAFDKSMDVRLLEIQSMTRLGPGKLRVDLLSGYGRDSVGTMSAPVTIEVELGEGGISRLRDLYDPELTAPALTWLAMNMPDADPSYT